MKLVQLPEQPQMRRWEQNILERKEEGSPALGTPGRSIIDEFLEKFQTAFDPPPRAFFGKNVAIFSKIMTTSTEFATKFFGSEMSPPLFQSFSGNS